LETIAEQDKKILVRYRETGDAAALDEVISRHYDFLYRLATRTCGNNRDAKDIVQ
jgi:RNA polymerase sigma-70 factor (ECF subfamily)